MKQYQPYWVKGEEHGDAQRECASRYEVIRNLAANFKRPFSVLDVGGNWGYFGFRLMEEFDCCYTIVDSKKVFPLMEANEVLDRSHWIPRRVSGMVLESWGRSDQFDIVLGLAVLHHFSEYEKAYKGIRHLGWWNVFEIPGEDDVGAANYFRHKGIRNLFGEPDGYFPSHVSESQRPYYVLENQPFIEEQTIDAADRSAGTHETYELDFTFDSCTFTKTGETRPWVPGMNLHNFLRLGGAWPDDPYIQRAIADTVGDHPDPYPWNYILGHGITPIDLGAR